MTTSLLGSYGCHGRDATSEVHSDAISPEKLACLSELDHHVVDGPSTSRLVASILAPVRLAPTRPQPRGIRSTRGDLGRLSSESRRLERVAHRPSGMNGRGPEVAQSRGPQSRVQGPAGSSRSRVPRGRAPGVRELIAETGPRIAKDRAHAARRRGPEALTSDRDRALQPSIDRRLERMPPQCWPDGGTPRRTSRWRSTRRRWTVTTASPSAPARPSRPATCQVFGQPLGTRCPSAAPLSRNLDEKQQSAR